MHGFGPHKHFSMKNNVTVDNDLIAAHVYGNNMVKSNSKLCIGNTCINENHLKVLTAQNPFRIRNHKSGQRLHCHHGNHGVECKMFHESGGWESQEFFLDKTN